MRGGVCAGVKALAEREVRDVRGRTRKGARASGRAEVSSTGGGPHSTKVDVGAFDQPLLWMHGVSGTGIRFGVNRHETNRSQFGQP